jgi:hypothetical protein
MALTFRMTAPPVLLVVLIQLLLQEISFTLGFTFIPMHARSPLLDARSAVRYNVRPSTGTCSTSTLLRVDLTDITSTTHSTGVTLQSLREMLQRLRDDLKNELRDPIATNNDKNDNERVRNRNLSPDELARETLLSTRIPNLALRHTRLGPSTIPGAGRGLFATHDIAEGDLITCYPGDALLYLPPDADHDVDEIVIWGGHVDEVYCWDEDAVFDGYSSIEDSDRDGHEGGRGGIDKRPLTDYALYVCDMYSVLGNPLLDSNPAYSGHFANDGAGHHAIDGCGGVDVGSEEGIAAYVNESIKMANAQNSVLEDSHMVTIATRNISEGDEILVTYGMDFWMEYVSF